MDASKPVSSMFLFEVIRRVLNDARLPTEDAKFTAHASLPRELYQTEFPIMNVSSGCESDYDVACFFLASQVSKQNISGRLSASDNVLSLINI